MKIDPAIEVPCRLGFFEVLSGFVDVSDPCYDTGVGCRATKIPTRNGTYTATVIKTGHGEEEGRCKVLEAVLDDAKGEWVQTEHDIGVDSGQAGIFDSKYYKDDQVGRKWKKKQPEEDNMEICEDEPWYSMCCDLTCGKMHAGVVPYGAVSSSGYGDGGYTLWVRMEDKLATGFRIVFIDSEQEQEELEEP
jgi:hypothetical protein